MLIARADSASLITEPIGVLAILLGVLAVIFWLTEHKKFGRVFKVVPALVFCYFVPTTLTTLGVLPESSPLYSWIKAFVLPASLLLLILALDVPGIIRLGPKAGIMLLAGTVGVVIGGPISLLICSFILPSSWALPDDVWRGMTALAGSWIGGGANFVALGDMAEASETMMATMVIPDVMVGSVWMGVLLYLAGRHHKIDRWTGANTQAIRALEKRLTDFQERVKRTPGLPDYLMMLALAFGASWISFAIGNELPEIRTQEWGTLVSHGTWKYVLVTTLGIILSFTPARNLEGVGASKIGSVMIYLLVACIGASANFKLLAEAPGMIVMGVIWILIHVAVLLGTGLIIRAPFFFIAVGSQANIGGAASAPVVAAAFHPALAPVGALLAVAGYVLGTYAGWVCMQLLRLAAGA